MDTKINELQDICEKVFELKKQVDVLNEQKTEKNKEIMKLKAEIIKHFEANKLTRFDTGFGTVTRKERRSVSITDRNEFFEYLESENLLRDAFNVTAARATTIYNELFERAQTDKNMDFIISGVPGLSDPSVFVDVSINKPRKRKEK